MSLFNKCLTWFLINSKLIKGVLGDQLIKVIMPTCPNLDYRNMDTFSNLSNSCVQDIQFVASSI